MRGRIAAACAAILVGLSPAGALPFARIAVAACASHDAHVQSAAREAQPAEAARTQVRSQSSRPGADRIAQIGEPSGPAQAQAPPAA